MGIGSDQDRIKFDISLNHHSFFANGVNHLLKVRLAPINIGFNSGIGHI